MWNWINFVISTLNSGWANTAIGTDALLSQTDGYSNTAIGDRAMSNSISTVNNVAVGYLSLRENNGSGNVAIGAIAMNKNIDGDYNTSVGEYSLGSNDTGDGNVAIGRLAGYDIGGDENVAIGNQAMSNDTSGAENTVIGTAAMLYNHNGSFNTVVGARAGFGNLGSMYSGNVLIGYRAGFSETNSNRLYIDNSSTNMPLIYGEFDNNMLRINGRQEVSGDLTIGDAVTVDESLKRLGIGTLSPSYPLDVAGTANLNKGITSGVAMRVNGDEALWYDDNYFSWGFGGTHNYFGDPVTVGPFEGGTTPFAKLHVIDDGFTYLQVESLSGDAVLQLSGNTNGPSIGWTMRRDASDNGKLQWRNDDFSKMTLTPGGNLGIGVSSHDPAYTLYVNGDAGKTIGGSSWIVASDRRLKQNINPYPEGLAEVMKIKPVTFQYNELSGRDTTYINVGTIAQELQEVSPHMVSEGKTGYLEVDDSAMTYMLINAVKELNTTQEKLISMIEDLQEKLEAQDRTIVELKGEQDRDNWNRAVEKQ